MTNVELHKGLPETEVIKISADERARVSRLREHFANFWTSASGDPRTIFDAFISATPVRDDVSLEAVNAEDVRGWWVRPRSSKPARAILFIHGGGYVQGSAEAYRGFVSQLVSRAQVPAFVMDYPLAPEATLPAAPDAALRAWRWLVDQGFKQIAIVGDSAGGGLGLVTLVEISTHAYGEPPVAGVVFSPWTDLSFSGASMTDPAVADPLINYEYLQDFAQKYLGGMDASSPIASPLFGELRGLPPLMIQVGTDERLFDDSRQFAGRAARSGVAVRLEVWEGMHHVFQLSVEQLESSKAALDRAASFLRHAFDISR